MDSVDGEKCKAGTGRAVAYMRHNYRENRNYTNSDIERSLSDKNMIFGADTYERARAAYAERLNSVERNMKRLRSDRVQGIELYIPEPEGLKNADRQEFFSKGYEELKDFFGSDNVIYGAVHLDEIHDYKDNSTGELKTSRAHMHALIVPYLDGRLCAKELMTRANFRALNGRFDGLAKEYGLVFQTGEQKKGVTVEELKGKGAVLEAQKEYDTIKQKTADLINSVEVRYAAQKSIIQIPPEPETIRKKGVEYVKKSDYENLEHSFEMNISTANRMARELYSFRALEPYKEVMERYSRQGYSAAGIDYLLSDGERYRKEQAERQERERKEREREYYKIHYDREDDLEL